MLGQLLIHMELKERLRVISITDFADERYKKGNSLFLFMSDKDEPIELIVKSHRVHKNFDLLTFEGYEDVNQVEKFKGGIIKSS